MSSSVQSCGYPGTTKVEFTSSEKIFPPQTRQPAEFGFVCHCGVPNRGGNRQKKANPTRLIFRYGGDTLNLFIDDVSYSSGRGYRVLENIRHGNLENEKAVEGSCNSISSEIISQIDDDFFLDNISMMGCSEPWPKNPSKCLSEFKNSKWTNPKIPGLVIKTLRASSSTTLYWSRTSADGRFVATGRGTIEDIAIPGRSIAVKGSAVDPIFSPDSKLYAFPGMICPQSKLYNPDIKEVGVKLEKNQQNEIVSREYINGCIRQDDVGHYGTMSADNYGDAFVLTGSWTSNTGLASKDSDPYTKNGALRLNKISNQSFNTVESLDFKIPGEKDFMLSPSGKFILSRFANRSGEQRYRIRPLRTSNGKVDPTRNDAIGTICVKGEKPMMSFDNRFIAFHHHADGSEQDKGAEKGLANIFVYDLKTKKTVRVTNMKNGSKAYFPHFRADGWLYFLIKEAGGGEQIVASNVTFLLKNQE